MSWTGEQGARSRRRQSDARRRARRGTATAVAAASLLACGTVQLTSEHDAVLARQAADLGASVESFLARMGATAGRPEGAYAGNAVEYDAFLAAVRQMRVRATASARSAPVVESLDRLAAGIGDLRALHERRGAEGLAPPLLGPARDALQAQFRALSTLEAELARGQGLTRSTERP